MQVFLGIVVETSNLNELRRWAQAKSLETPIVRPLAAVQRSKARPNVELEAAAHRIFEYWRVQTGRNRRTVPGDRIAKVKARLRERMELYRQDGAPEGVDYLMLAEADLRQAVDGAVKAPTVNETTGRKYDDLELICRNASKVEDFMARAGGDKQTDELRRRFG